MFSPDGKLACYSREDGVIGVWDVGKMKEVARFRAGELPVYHVVFSNNSRSIASANADGTILVWDVSGFPR